MAEMCECVFMWGGVCVYVWFADNIVHCYH